MKKYILALLLIIITSVLATFFIFNPTPPIKKDVIYQLEDGSNVSQSKLLSFQDDVVSEYNKNFERYPPENKQFYSDFILNSSFSSEIDLTYYGEALFCFGYKNTTTPTHDFYYIGKNDTKQACGIVVFSPDLYMINMSLVFSDFDARSTNVNNLTHDTARQWASDFYEEDYSYYILDNASSSQRSDPNYNNLIEAAKNLHEIDQTGSELDRENATIQYYNLAEDLGFSDDSARKMLEDLESNNLPQAVQSNEQAGFSLISFSYIPFSPFDIIWAFGLLILGVIYVIVKSYIKNKLEKQGASTSAEYLENTAISPILGIAGVLGYISLGIPQGGVGIYQLAVIVICYIVGVGLAIYYEKYKRANKTKSNDKSTN
ncbi:hypothetical protein [Methanoregula sp.]|uniref:hypothetical protein n=1 Tax=Methanoregula sp. TaxID=2052170 RepID=UPI003BAF1D08